VKELIVVPLIDRLSREGGFMKEIIIGINGLGRMGKLILWQSIATEQLTVVINIGREVGKSLDDLLDYILFDSTYGSLELNLFGRFHNLEVDIKHSPNGNFKINKTWVIVLREERNPKNISWEVHGVQVVIETTGKFNYPDREAYYSEEDCIGSVQGHFCNSTVRKVLISSPLEGLPTDDSKMIVMGVNGETYEPDVHRIISNASCSTNCLASIVAPIVEYFGAERMIAMVVPIEHAKTGKQPALDRLPAAGKSDPCTYRSSRGSAFISSTGAANALKKVISGLEHVQFSADSIRVDAETVSLVCASVIFRSQKKCSISDFWRIFEERASRHVKCLERSIFSGNVIGSEKAALIDFSKSSVMTIDDSLQLVKLYGWFDNEWGYVSTLIDNLQTIIRSL